VADGSPPRVGVYVCQCGGNISDVVDVERVVAAASMLKNVVIARQNTFMCSDPGQGMIQEDIRNEKLERVVVAACSPSLHELTFRATLLRADLNPYLYEHANIREQVSWVSKSDPERATDKAIRLVAAAVAKVSLLEPLEPLRVDAKPYVAVVGGGVSGLTCARDLSCRGFEVSLIEKSRALGGHMLELGRVYPTEEYARDLLRGLVEAVSADARIHVHTEAELIDVSGSVGKFRLSIRNGAGTIGVEAGAIVLATGFDSYVPRKGEFAYGEHPEVISLPDLARRLDAEAPTGGGFALNGHTVKNVCLIHCVGSRQVEGVHEPGPNGKINDYCSRYCCTATLRAANEIRDRFPDVNVFDIHQDIRTYGHGHEDYYEGASRRGVVFVRHASEDPPIVLPNDAGGDFPLVVRVRDTLTFGEELDIPADLVVLATGMVPREVDRLAEILKLPRSSEGFLQEVHPKLRPVELAIDGILIAGTCQAPMDIAESCASASAAAVKASALLAKGYIEIDPFFIEIDEEACDGCGLCIDECRFVNALSPVEGGKPPVVDAALCRGCGMCAAVCPTGAIQVRGWGVDYYDAMVDAILEDQPAT
jgi:heterodisulfide reductase subunit A